MTNPQKEKLREEWSKASGMYDIAASVRPLVTNWWFAKFDELLAEKAEEIRKRKKEETSFSKYHVIAENAALESAANLVEGEE